MKQKLTGNARYDNNINRLSEYLYNEERQRRSWTNEQWGYPTGKIFKYSKIMFILSAILTFFLSMIYFFVWLFYSEWWVENLFPVISLQMRYFFSILAISSGFFIILALVFFILKKYMIVAVSGIASVFAIFIHYVMQFFVKNPIKWSFNAFALSAFAVFGFCSAALFWIIYKEKRYISKLCDQTISNLRETKKSDRLLSLDEYSELIEKYLESKKQKGKKS